MFSIKQTINKKPIRPSADILTKDKADRCILGSHPKGEERVSEHSAFCTSDLSSKDNLRVMRK